MTLIEKLAKIAGELGTFQPDKTNTQQRYDYISADQVLSRVGALQAKHGVMILPAITEEVITTVPWKNGDRYDAMVGMEMTITDGETSIVQQWIGRGSDYSVPDKATYKAITSGHKYFLMKLHNIGQGNEDGEHDELPEPPQRQPQQGAPKAPPPPTPPEEVITMTPEIAAARVNLINDGVNGRVTVGHLNAALRDSKVYNNIPHAMNTVKLYDKFPAGYDVDGINGGTELKLESALNIFDWAMIRKGDRT